MLRAQIFDVDGTLADTETAHRNAFNAAFAEVGPDWHWSESLYAGLLDVAGGKERLRYYWSMIDPDEAGGGMVTKMIAADIRIAPSILSADFSRLGEEVRTIEAAGADLIHFDVMDKGYRAILQKLRTQAFTL